MGMINIIIDKLHDVMAKDGSSKILGSIPCTVSFQDTHNSTAGYNV